MVSNLMYMLVLICLGAGLTLFHALSVIERGSRRLMFNAHNSGVQDSQAHRTVSMLQHVVPFFPPFQGAVMLGTVTGLGWRAYAAGSAGLELISLLSWLLIMLYIMVFRRIGASVEFLKGEVEQTDNGTLRLELGRVMGSHHLALGAYVLAILLELVNIFF